MKKVLIGGFFDLFHCGHLRTLKKAKELGDYLVVFVGSDKEAKQLKGENRPIIPGEQRAEIISSCKYVDEVLYSEDVITNKIAIDLVKPDVYIQNLMCFNLEDEKECQKRGITIVKFPKEENLELNSTTEIIEKIKEIYVYKKTGRNRQKISR